MMVLVSLPPTRATLRIWMSSTGVPYSSSLTGPIGPVRQPHFVHRLEERGRVVGLAAGGLERLLDDEQRGIGARRVETGIVLVGVVDAGNELLVVRRVEARGVPAGAVDADRFLAHHLEDALIGHGRVAEHGDLALEAEFGERLEEAQRVGACKASVDGVDVLLDLRKIDAVFGCVERRQDRAE